MTRSPSIVVAGIDVGKSKLDTHLLDSGLERQFDNTKPGRRALRNWLLKHGVTRTVFEPTGRYHRNLHQCPADAGLDTVVVNPLRSRRFAEAVGQLAKNDRVDAVMLARFGLLDSLEATPPQPRNLRLLSDLLALHRKLLGVFIFSCLGGIVLDRHVSDVRYPHLVRLCRLDSALHPVRRHGRAP